MKENLFQFIWLHRLYGHSKALETIDGEPLLVINPGILNTHAGPDFLAAKIKIGNTIWVGNVELHLKSSDWFKHQHQTNKAYAKLILHVVYEHDEVLPSNESLQFPTLELKDYIQLPLLEKYNSMMNAIGFIPCEEKFSTISLFTKQVQLDRMLIERIEEKTHHLTHLLQKYRNNWQEVFYIQMAKGFGLHINQDVFESLAMHTPLKLLTKYKHNPLQIEALLFGQSGFLDDYFDEAYPLALQKEYHYLQNLHQLQPIEKHLWKFLRLRPANFPTLRIAQFAALISNSSQLFSKITEAESLNEIENYFTLTLHEFWLTHYSFQEKSAEKNKNLGKTFIQNLIINAIVPTLFIFGKVHGNEVYCERALDFLQQLPAEKNSITEAWKNLGLAVNNAADTQALLQLKHHYCDTKLCLSCTIGYSILNEPEHT
ncbi:MAG: DUF2851 family protein [Bacteroidetes bacterium]|nr:DUF2851 family protein [Bacteroidota bacterium]